MNIWYSEISKYTFGQEDLNCGHFSQMIWTGSKKAGFGRAISHKGEVYIVAQYSPPGNVRGEWTNNVKQPKDKRKDTIQQLQTGAARKDTDIPPKMKEDP